MVENNIFKYNVTNELDYKSFIPIVKNMEWKMLNGWDDYNELSHCCKLINSYSRKHNAWINIHTVEESGEVVGCLLIIGGEADFSSYGLEIKNNKENVMLNYFHVSPMARGIGTNWLTKEIFSYYREKKIRNIYVKSSHETAWSLYERYGKEIGCYKASSDNNIFERNGKIFVLEL